MSLRVLPIVVVLASTALAGCGVNSYCLVEQDYQKARVVPELRSTDGLEMPDSPSALRLPPAPADAEPFGVRNEAGEGQCLDRPPTIALPPANAGDEAKS